ncbi:MAG: hypothetical protein ACLVHV_14440 [Oscillospiraceae bacterium]
MAEEVVHHGSDAAGISVRRSHAGSHFRQYCGYRRISGTEADIHSGADAATVETVLRV